MLILQYETVVLVLQDDIVMGTLTVRENFLFSASLRLPSSLSSKERNEKVDTVIQELGLTHCADTKVNLTRALCLHRNKPQADSCTMPTRCKPASNV